jgi:tetratricopeptide (TPR) repeat protein
VREYERILDLVPGHEEAKKHLAEHYSHEEMWDHLVALYEDCLAAHPANGTMSEDFLAMHAELGRIKWKMRERSEAAEPHYELVRHVHPADPEMLDFWRQRCCERGDLEKLRSVLSDARRVATGPAQRELALELAHLAEETANAQQAIEQFRAVLRTDAHDARAREALCRLYESTGAHNSLLDLLRSELASVPADDKSGQVSVMWRIARVYRDHLKSEAALTGILGQIAQLDPENAEVLRELVRLYEGMGRSRELLTVQMRLADIERDPRVRVEILRSVADKWNVAMSNVPNAIAGYEAIVAIDPTDAQAVSRLRELYEKRRAFDKLRDLLRSLAQRVAGEQREGLLVEAARLSLERMHRADDAKAICAELVDGGTISPQVLQLCADVSERTGAPAILARALEVRLRGHHPEDDRVLMLLRLAQLLHTKLGDAGGATRAYAEVVQGWPGHPKATRALREIYLSTEDYPALEALYGGDGDVEALADALVAAAERATEPRAKIALSLRVATVYATRLDSAVKSFRAYERVLAVDPTHPIAARALVPFYEAEGRWARLPPLVEVLLERTEDRHERAEMLWKLAKMAREKLGDKPRAFDYARRAFDARADEASLEAFGAAAEACGAWDAFAGALRAELAKSEDPERTWSLDGAPRVAFERALREALAKTVARGPGRAKEALDVYRDLLHERPDDPSIIASYMQLAMASGTPTDHRWLFEHRLEHCADGARLDLLMAWAHFEETNLKSPERAIDLYRNALMIVPNHGPALRSVSRLLRERGDSEGAREMLERDRDMREGAERVARELELARLALGAKPKPREALACAERALEIAPHDPDVIAFLEELLPVAETRARAADLLDRAYSETGNLSRQSAVVRVLIATAASKDDRVRHYQRLAEIHDKLGAQFAAFDVLVQATAEFPRELEMWDRLAVLANRTQRFQEFVDALAGQVTPAGAPHLPRATMLDLAERLATLYQERIGDLERAYAYFQLVLGGDPTNERALIHVKQILTALERWPELLAVFENVGNASTDPRQAAAVFAEAAVIAEDILGDRTRAMGLYERVQNLDPTEETSSFALEKLYRAEGEWTKLASLLERRVTPESEAQSKLRLAMVLQDKVHDRAGALPLLEHVAQTEPTNRELQRLLEDSLRDARLTHRASIILERIYRERGEFREVVRVLEARLAITADRQEREDLLRVVADLKDEKLSDDAGAYQAYRELVELSPRDAIAFRVRLASISDRLGMTTSCRRFSSRRRLRWTCRPSARYSSKTWHAPVTPNASAAESPSGSASFIWTSRITR